MMTKVSGQSPNPRNPHIVVEKGDEHSGRCNSAENVRILPPISGRLIRSRRPEAGFRQKRWQFGTRSVCRNTDEFPVPGTAALIGGLMSTAEKG
jgi:hypothetical protein